MWLYTYGIYYTLVLRIPYTYILSKKKFLSSYPFLQRPVVHYLDPSPNLQTI